ncbi:MAG: hypothetical protein ABF990_13940 [Acetobacter sp.]|uniref:hypothetical protein n=1 Tax=Acetobacter sp. TaxID=440 RepID=UPI0039EB4332
MLPHRRVLTGPCGFAPEGWNAGAGLAFMAMARQMRPAMPVARHGPIAALYSAL